MKFESLIPNPALAEYIRSIDYIEGNNIGTGLPKRAMSMVFNLADGFKLYDDHTFTNHSMYEKYWVAGLQMHQRHVETFGKSKVHSLF